MQFTVSTAASQTSSSTSIVTPNQSIEGFNFDDMAWGTSNAKPVTVSVWVYSSLVGQYAIWIRNSAADRFYATPFTITTANTWQQVTATIAGDTSGTWIGATNGIGATVGICLAAGSSRVGAGNTWSGSSFYGVTGQVDWQATSSNTFYFTGFQLEKGNIATSFDVRPYGTELQLCQRYYQQIGKSNNVGYQPYGVGVCTNTTDTSIMINLPVMMRSNPTFTFTGATNTFAGTGGIFVTSVVSDIMSPTTILYQAIVASGLTAGNGARHYQNAASASSLELSAEL
jgi:hypothetical protein